MGLAVTAATLAGPDPMVGATPAAPATKPAATTKPMATTKPSAATKPAPPKVAAAPKPAPPPKPPAPKLAPSVFVEAENFTVEKGWKPIRIGEGNYMVDIIGFGHISGERLLHADSNDTTASAYYDVQVPVNGNYRLWVRYEYPAFTETRFKVVVEQDGKVIAETVMGTKASLRLGFASPKLTAQHDPSWGPEGLFEEPLDVPVLKAGKARVYLKTVEQPQVAGVSANRNIDCIFLTSDLGDFMTPEGKPNPDSWWNLGGGGGMLYPLLNVAVEVVGPRYEFQITNKGQKPIKSVLIRHTYNRVPWGEAEVATMDPVEAGQASKWIGITKQDTAHFSMIDFSTANKEPFEVAIRPVGGEVQKTLVSDEAFQTRVYLPSYPGKGEVPITPIEELDAVLKDLASHPAPGRVPTLPLTYGSLYTLGDKTEYERKYTELYMALGLRSWNGPMTRANAEFLKKIGIPIDQRSGAVSSFRNLPIKSVINDARSKAEKEGTLPYFKFWDCGDEIGFGEFMEILVEGEREARGDKKLSPDSLINELWPKWLEKNHPGYKPEDYWLSSWGPVDPSKLHPDKSTLAATEKPRLYVDSIEFYEQTIIGQMAKAAEDVRAAFGNSVYVGANYSNHPFYYPSIEAYIRWFRGGASDFGRHSEYVWQVGQLGPMINGYVAEHFRSGMRFNKHTLLKQYTMPHSPGNTGPDFVRTAFSHLAHGAKMLDYFGMGMNETFTENHIDHRDHERFRLIRDINSCIGLVEDQMLESQVVPSRVAILVSESTQRWDEAGIATGGPFGPTFRNARLHFHQERVGLWEAFTYAGESPDLLIEQDLKPEVLNGYKILVLVGDSIPAETVPALENWVKAGGVLVATGGVGRFGAYREANPTLQRFLGIESRTTVERDTFLRPRQELPFIKPIDQIAAVTEAGAAWHFPALVIREEITPTKDAKVIAKDDSGAAVAIARNLGAGRILFVGTLPGVAYFWSSLQPAMVPDRGPGVHTLPYDFDKGVTESIDQLLHDSGVQPRIHASIHLVDTRLIQGAKAYFMPIANYDRQVGGDVTFKVTLPESKKIVKVTSAYGGEIPFKTNGNDVEFVVPKLGYGDMVRLDF